MGLVLSRVKCNSIENCGSGSEVQRRNKRRMASMEFRSDKAGEGATSISGEVYNVKSGGMKPSKFRQGKTPVIGAAACRPRGSLAVST